MRIKNIIFFFSLAIFLTGCTGRIEELKEKIQPPAETPEEIFKEEDLSNMSLEEIEEELEEMEELEIEEDLEEMENEL